MDLLVESARFENLQPYYEKILDFVNYILAKEKTLLFGRSFAWLCMKENQERVRIAEILKYGGMPTTKALCCCRVFGNDPDGALPILSKTDSIALARSLQDIRERCIRGRRLGVSDPLYYLCADAVVRPYGESELKGYASVWLRVAHAILDTDNPVVARQKIEEYLLK